MPIHVHYEHIKRHIVCNVFLNQILKIDVTESYFNVINILSYN